MNTVAIRTDYAGRIRPLHGVNSGPVTAHFTFDATEYFKSAGIPYARLHDIEYPFGAGEYVDIHCIFPDMRADETDPANYNFALTDEYCKAICAAGCRPFFRLGTTIEHQPVKRYIYAPKDPAKWARVASRIVAHYNEGWADGFAMGIEYWEIWNEPDLASCWIGTEQAYFELYAAAASLLKADHPAIRVGGCAASYPNEYCDRFLAFVKARGVPLDFFSWHFYFHTLPQLQWATDRVAQSLAQSGLGGVENIFDEWNYMVDWNTRVQQSYDFHTTPACAAFMAATLCALQKAGVDKAMYYQVQMTGPDWNGVFAPTETLLHGESGRAVRPLPPFYALQAWHDLTACGDRELPVTLTVPDGELFLAAAGYRVLAGGKRRCMLLAASYADEGCFGQSPPATKQLTVTVDGAPAEIVALCRVDGTNCYQKQPAAGSVLTLPGNSFVLATVEF